DYNDNGSFDDPGEQIVATGNIAGGAPPYSATYTVPLNAPIGMHRLRVRTADAGIVNSCSDNGNMGEVEDYMVNVTPPPACTGAPAPGNTLASTSLACATTNITLSLQNQTAGSGVTYQWQMSSDGTAYTDIPDETLSTATVTQTADNYYRCLVTCDGSSTYSNPVLVYYSDICYCTNPVYSSGAGCDFGIYLNNITFAGINNTTGCNPTPPFYQYYNQ